MGLHSLCRSTFILHHLAPPPPPLPHQQQYIIAWTLHSVISFLVFLYRHGQLTDSFGIYTIDLDGVKTQSLIRYNRRVLFGRSIAPFVTCGLLYRGRSTYTYTAIYSSFGAIVTEVG